MGSLISNKFEKLIKVREFTLANDSIKACVNNLGEIKKVFKVRNIKLVLKLVVYPY